MKSNNRIEQSLLIGDRPFDPRSVFAEIAPVSLVAHGGAGGLLTMVEFKVVDGRLPRYTYALDQQGQMARFDLLPTAFEPDRVYKVDAIDGVRSVAQFKRNFMLLTAVLSVVFLCWFWRFIS